MRADSARRIAFLLCAIVFSAAAQAQAPTCRPAKEWPAKLRLEYAVTASRGPFSLSGESVLEFVRIGDAYTITVNTDAALIYHASQISRGTIDASGLRPGEFVEDRSGREKQTTTFDWNAGTVAFSNGANAPGRTQPGLQDRASLLVQLTWLHRANEGGAVIEVPVAGARRVATDRFVSRGPETLKMPVGTVQAMRVEREGDADQDRLEAWFGDAWCGLPVRIRFTDHKGGVIDQRLRAATIE